MSYGAYDIYIWHKSIWPILESKEASKPQDSHPWIWFWRKNCLNMPKIKSVSRKFFLYKFWDSFVFSAQKYRSRGSTSPYLSEVNLMFMESVEHREWENSKLDNYEMKDDGACCSVLPWKTHIALGTMWQDSYLSTFVVCHGRHTCCVCDPLIFF